MPTLQIQISRYTWFERSYDNTPRWKSQNINFKILTKENRCNRCKKYIEDFLHFGMSHWITLLEKAQNAFMWIFIYLICLIWGIMWKCTVWKASWKKPKMLLCEYLLFNMIDLRNHVEMHRVESQIRYVFIWGSQS